MASRWRIRPVAAASTALYHSQSVGFFTHVPGLAVAVLSTPYDARGSLRSSIRDEDPVLFFEHKKMTARSW